MSRVDMSPDAVRARLRLVAERSDLRTPRPLIPPKVGGAPAEIKRRLERVSQLRELCLELGRIGRRL